MIEILAALSAAAATGIRIALPLLVIGLLQGEKLWSGVPILSSIYPPVVLGVLTSGSLVEIFASKQLLGQRMLQVVYLLLSPFVGTAIAIAVSDLTSIVPKIFIAIVGGLFALLLQVVQAGCLYRWRSLPQWLPFLQDGLCVLLVYLAVKIPLAGGIIALFLLGLAVYNSQQLHRWLIQQHQSRKWWMMNYEW